jgi:cytochrome P450
LRETLAPDLQQGAADLVDFGFRAMMNLTADFSGVDRPLRTPEETARLLTILRTFGKAATLGQALGDKEAIRAEIRAALEEFDAVFFRPSMSRRRRLLDELAAGRCSEAELPRDILTELLRHESEHPLPPDVLMKEIGFFLLAGAFTSIHTLTHAMHDIFSWSASHPEDAQRYAEDAVFLQKAIHESMRLHPSSPTAGRRPTCPMHLPSGQDVSPQDLISVDLMAANRDTRIFGEDAADYNPHRPAPRGASPYGLSFGIGMHSCLGLTLAAGSLPRAGADAREHHLGTVSLIARTLMQHGARPDPANPGVVDRSTIRNNWSLYPILLNP